MERHPRRPRDFGPGAGHSATRTCAGAETLAAIPATRLVTDDQSDARLRTRGTSSPQADARAHPLGGRRTILNAGLADQWASLLDVLAHRPRGARHASAMAVTLTYACGHLPVRFDYASVSGVDLPERFAVLVLAPGVGTVIRQLDPPAQ